MLPVLSYLKGFARVFALVPRFALSLEFGAGLVYLYRALPQKSSVQSLNCRISLIVVGHLNKRKTTRTTGVTILDNRCRLDSPMRLE